MDSQNQLFSLFFSKSLDQMAPMISNVLDSIDEYTRKGTSDNTIEKYFEQVFKVFPRKHAEYVSAISTMKSLSESNPEAMLMFLTKRVKELLKFNQDSPFFSINSVSKVYSSDQNYQNTILRYFGLFFVTDLVCQIVIDWKPLESMLYLVRCGYKVCACKQNIHRLISPIIRQWSVILSIISEIDFTLVSQTFFVLTEPKNISEAFSIIRFIRLDQDLSNSLTFFNRVICIIKSPQIKKMLSATMLDSIAFMIITLPYHKDTYNSLIDIVWPFLNDKMLRNGAVSLASVLLSKMPKNISRIKTFMSNYIFGNYDDRLVKGSLRAFRYFVFGNLVNPQWIFWEWGIKSRSPPLEFIKWNSEPDKLQSDSTSFTSIFMNTFFLKANFRVSPTLFCKTLVHLAALDFNHFLNEVLEQFIRISVEDYRIVCLLMTVEMINSNDFAQMSYSKVDKNMINEFNMVMRTIIIPALPYLIDPQLPHPCIIFDELYLEHEMNNYTADVAMTEILECSESQVFYPFLKKHKKATPSNDEHNLRIQILKCIPYCFNDEDFLNKKIMDLILSLIHDKCELICKLAVQICKEVYTKPEYIEAFCLRIIEILPKTKVAEPYFMYLYILKCTVLHKNCKNQEIFVNAEFMAFTGLFSEYSSTRLLSYCFLNHIHPLLYQKGFISILEPFIKTMNDTVQTRLVHYLDFDENRQNMKSMSYMSFQTCMASSYFDIWLIYISEIGNILASSQYPSFIDKLQGIDFESMLKDIQYSNNSTAFMILIFYSLIGEKGQFLKAFYPTRSLRAPVYEKEIMVRYRDLLIDMLAKNQKAYSKVCYVILRNIHPFLESSLIELYNNCTKAQLYEASSSLNTNFLSPFISSDHIMLSMPSLFRFIIRMQQHLTSKKEWLEVFESCIDEEEMTFLEKCSIVRNFSRMLFRMLTYCSNGISKTDFPMPNREQTFKMFILLSSTKSPKIFSTKKHCACVLSKIVKSCQVFSSSHSFDDNCLNGIYQLNQRYSDMLEIFLHNHIDVLLEVFIDAFFLKDKAMGNTFFEAIYANIVSCDLSIASSCFVQLALLCSVLYRSHHPKSNDLMLFLVKHFPQFICISINDDLNNYKLYELFAGITESIFQHSFRYLRDPGNTVSFLEITESLRSWIKNIRLLPKQTHCVKPIIIEYAAFTPYQFLHSLMMTTEIISEERFPQILPLWFDLLSNIDQFDVIITFLLQWPHTNVVESLFANFVGKGIDNVLLRLCQRCSFSFYHYVTDICSESFDQYLWSTSLIALHFARNLDDLYDIIPTLCHFCLVFRNNGAFLLFSTICIYFSIDFQCDSFSDSPKGCIVSQLLEKIGNLNDNSAELWANESMKWVIGCKNLHFALLSLKIFNKLRYPIEPLFITGVCKAIHYHLRHNAGDAKLLCEFVSESFCFYHNSFDGNEDYCYQYVSSFFDCRPFIENSLMNAMPILIKALSSQHTNTQSWKDIVSIVRPLLLRLENDPETQNIFDKIISTINSEELMLIAAPIKKMNTILFPSSLPCDQLINNASEFSLLKVLSHYTFMLTSASKNLKNSIFQVTEKVLERIKSKKNPVSLSKIFQIALNSMKQCPNAISLINQISKECPSVSMVKDFDPYEWNRTIEDVLNSLSKLPTNDIVVPVSLITDCKTYNSVYCFLNDGVKPTILPFSAQKEMIDSMVMLKMQKNPSPQNIPLLIPDTPHKPKKPNPLMLEYSFPALVHPEKLIFWKMDEQNGELSSSLKSISDFLKP